MRQLTTGLSCHTVHSAILRRTLATWRPAMATPLNTAVITTGPKGSGKTATCLTREPSTPQGHKIRKFDYEHDLQDLMDICANVYGGTDYMPRIIHRIAQDPGVLVLAAEAVSGASQSFPHEPKEAGAAKTEEAGSQMLGIIDGIICGERRGEAVWLYGLRVREGVRGRGLGHQLMEAIVCLSPELLAGAPDAHPPPPRPSAPPSAPSAPSAPPRQSVAAPSDDPVSRSQTAPAAATAPPQPPSTSRAASTPRTATSSTGSGPIRYITTCTVTYNVAAQRIIRQQLPGPLYEVEVWPGQQLLEAYEAAVGWKRGVGLPPGVPCILDWIPGAREVLEADAAAQALLPRWRQVRCDRELRSAVQSLLYVDNSRDYGFVTDGVDELGGIGRGNCQGGAPGEEACLEKALEATSQGALMKGSQELLWLPMPYDLWPLDSAFVRRELAAGSIWVLTDPSSEPAEPATGDHDAPGEASTRGHHSIAAGHDGGSAAEGGAYLGVMLLTHFETLSRVCAGILAQNNAVVHSAIAHAGRLQPHFCVSTLRIPAGCKQNAQIVERTGRDPVEKGAGKTEGEEPGEEPFPLPALYSAAGGYRGVLMYGSVATPPATRP